MRTCLRTHDAQTRYAQFAGEWQDRELRGHSELTVIERHNRCTGLRQGVCHGGSYKADKLQASAPPESAMWEAVQLLERVHAVRRLEFVSQEEDPRLCSDVHAVSCRQ